MIDFSYMKKKLLEGEETIDDTERVITFIPNQFSDFDSELCLSNVEMKPKEDEGMADEDLRFLNQCQKILHKLAYVRNQYMFSEQFLGKNENQIVPQVGEQFKMVCNKVFMIPWGHIKLLIDKCHDNTEKFNFYIDKIIENN